MLERKDHVPTHTTRQTFLSFSQKVGVVYVERETEGRNSHRASKAALRKLRRPLHRTGVTSDSNEHVCAMETEAALETDELEVRSRASIRFNPFVKVVPSTHATGAGLKNHTG